MSSDSSTTTKTTYNGRIEILTDYESITSENVLEVLNDSLVVHSQNQSDISYLYKYYRGVQPILEKEKTVRPEINNRIVENRANEIVTFKVGYLLCEPIQYISRGKDTGDKISDEINQLNEFAFAESKASEDKKLLDWMHIAGVGYRMILPDKVGEEDEAPFEIYTLDPRWTFVVKSNVLGRPPVMAVTYRGLKDGTYVYSIYTKDRYFEVTNGSTITVNQPHTLGAIPIIEYDLNAAKLGSFEIVLDLLDAINTVDSNRVDGVEQFVQAIMLLKNVQMADGALEQLSEMGAFQYKDIDNNMKAEVSYITSELNQAQTQTLIEHFYDVVLTICGMPNRNGGSSTSDTGSAVIMRDGWSAAEARANDTELMFKKAEKEFLKILLSICRKKNVIDLKLANIDIKFTRRNYENIQGKAQVLCEMLNNDKIAPKLAFIHSGMFTDAEDAYRQSMEYQEERQGDANVETGLIGGVISQSDGRDEQTVQTGNAPIRYYNESSEDSSLGDDSTR